MKAYDIAIFDLDGTLLDTSEGVLSSVKYVIKEMGLTMPSEETLRTFIGPPVSESLTTVFGLSHEEVQYGTELFRNHYRDIDLLKAMPYEGIYEVFENLLKMGITPAVATYKRQDYTTQLLHHFNFHQYTDILYGSDFEGKLNKKDIIAKCMKKGGIDNYQRAVMVGDTIYDAVGAQKLSVDFIGVTYGFGFKTDKEIFSYNAVGSADTPVQLLKYFR